MAFFLGGIAIAHYLGGPVRRFGAMCDGGAAAAALVAGRAASGARRHSPRAGRIEEAGARGELMDFYLDGMRKAGLD